MKKFIVAALTATSVFAATVVASGVSFSISEPLSTDGPVPSPWVVSGTTIPAIVGNALLLTDSTGGQSGFALYDEAVAVTRGIDVTFSQAQWGGSGADGIVFFVKKGNDTSTTPGAGGGGMGYSADASTSTAGLSGALLGVGLDAYGNFASVGSDGPDCVTSFTRGSSNSISVRGAGQGQLGYCLLDNAYDLTANALQPLSAGYSSRLDAARTVRVVIDSATASNPRVRVFYDGSAAPVIDIPLPATFSAVSTVKIGFAAGTGGSTDNHAVWGLTSTAAESSGEELADTGSSEAFGLGALVVATLAGIAAVALRPRRRAQQ